MDIRDIDLNLLRLFDAIYRSGSVSRAADALNLSQPAASQGLTRLRVSLGDPLFVRSPGGVRPTLRGARLAHAVQGAIAMIEAALNEGEQFEPSTSRMRLRLHLNDIGEALFLPRLIETLRKEAPGVTVDSCALPHDAICASLDAGIVDLALGFIPDLVGTQSLELVRDRYSVFLRAGHPALLGQGDGGLTREQLGRLDYVAIRAYGDTVRVLQEMGIDKKIRITSSNFLALPAIVKTTDLAVVLPMGLANYFADSGGYAVSEAQFAHGDFPVMLHWSKRFELDPAHQWMRDLVIRLFKESR